MRWVFCAALGAAALYGSMAGAKDLSNYVGYRVVANKIIEGYVDENGKRDDSFEGCDFERKIIFTDGTYLVCSGYSYMYAYRPTAVILVKDGDFVMLVGDNEFHMRRF
jgi:hypothetical protein